MKLLGSITVLLMAVTLFGCPTMRPNNLVRPEIIKAEDTYTHAASGMIFPLTIGDFKRSKVIRYDAEGLDMSAGYDSATAAGPLSATVYVYPAQSLVSIESPPDVIVAARNRLAQNEFEARKREIMQFRPGVVMIEERDVSLQQGNTSYSGRMATFEYQEMFAGQRQLLHSHLYVYCYVGGKWVIKYRFTHPRFFDATKEMNEFMKNLSWTLI
jgi:hypothetical protein